MQTFDLEKRPNSSDTKERILEAAELLFAERGYDATSLRAITSRAGANLAAVNYHFQSKEALMQAVFARRLEPLNRARLAMLEKLEAAAGSDPVAVENIVRALIAPVLRLRDEPSETGLKFGTLMGRIYSEPRLWQILRGESGDVVPRFIASLRRALPELPTEDFFWRIHFTIGAMSHTLSGIPMLELVSNGACDPSDVDGVIERLTAFVSAGLLSPPTLQGKTRNVNEPSDLQSKSSGGAPQFNDSDL